MRVEWSALALLRLTQIRAYIAQFNPAAAERVGRVLREAGDSLQLFPLRGRRNARGNRELVIPRLRYRYLLEYAVEQDRVVILTIWHGRQQRG